MRKRFVLLGTAAFGALVYMQRDRIISWFLTKVFDGMDEDEQNDQVVASNTPQVHDYLNRARRVANVWQPPSDPTSPLTGKPLPMSRDETVD